MKIFAKWLPNLFLSLGMAFYSTLVIFLSTWVSLLSFCGTLKIAKILSTKLTSKIVLII